MALENIISLTEASTILNVNRRTVSRYAEKGLLKRKEKGQQHLYSRSQVELLKKKVESREMLDDCIKELYVSMESRMNKKTLVREFNIEKVSDITYALQVYKHQRGIYLDIFGIQENEKKSLFLVEEVTARLKLKDKHVIYDLVNEGELEAKKISFKGRERYFIKKDSLIRYLGDYSKKVLYRSKDVEELNPGMTINIIDRIAKINSIGFKIKVVPQGRYLFSQSDIGGLRKGFLRGDHLWYKDNSKNHR